MWAIILGVIFLPLNAQRMRIEDFARYKKPFLRKATFTTDKQSALLDLYTNEKGFQFFVGEVAVPVAEAEGFVTLSLPNHTAFLTIKHPTYGQIAWKVPDKELKKIPKEDMEIQIEKAMRLTRLSDVRGRLISNLSKGYKQRVGLAQAILGFPEIIILDEPTVGLDPKQIIEIRELIRKLAKEHTVILSSHILAEIREVCDYILIIARGKLVASDTPENLENSMSGTGHIEIEVRREQKEVERVLDRIDQVKRVEYTLLEDGTVRAQIEAKGSGDIRERIFHAFADQKMPLLTLKLNKSTLEEIFLELTQK